jgi:hypothetical protein
MVSGISNALPAERVAQPSPTPARKPAQSNPQSAPVADSVQLSPAAQAILASLQEARETPSQTSKEANQGDTQAQKLLAQEAAAKSEAR